MQSSFIPAFQRRRSDAHILRYAAQRTSGTIGHLFPALIRADGRTISPARHIHAHGTAHTLFRQHIEPAELSASRIASGGTASVKEIRGPDSIDSGHLRGGGPDEYSCLVVESTRIARQTARRPVAHGGKPQ